MHKLVLKEIDRRVLAKQTIIKDVMRDAEVSLRLKEEHFEGKISELTHELH